MQGRLCIWYVGILNEARKLGRRLSKPAKMRCGSLPYFTIVYDLCTLQKVELHILDLSRPRDVIKFAQEFVSTGKPLDVLVRRERERERERELTSQTAN